MFTRVLCFRFSRRIDSQKRCLIIVALAAFGASGLFQYTGFFRVLKPDHWVTENTNLVECRNYAWCEATLMSVDETLQLQEELKESLKNKTLDLASVPWPPLSLMKSVAGRDILKREICEGSSKNDHLTCGRHVQQFCVTDTRVTMTTTLRNSSDGFLCKDSTKIMILIISAPGNFEKRTNIRTTWGNNSVMNPIFPEVQLAFLVGKTNSTEDSKKIFEESIKYEDMIHILDHIDAYKNLTYKVLSGYQWALQNCRNVEVIGKFDDDIFVDMKTFVLAVKKYIRKNDAAVIGSKTPRDAVDRKPGRKYSTTWNEYNEISYPYALRGMAYLVTKTHAVVVLAATLGAHPLNWDDRYITGIWAMKLGSRQIFWNSLLMDYKLRGCRPLQEWVDGNSTSMSTPAILCAKGPLYKPAFQKMLLVWNQTEVTVV